MIKTTLVLTKSKILDKLEGGEIENISDIRMAIKTIDGLDEILRKLDE